MKSFEELLNQIDAFIRKYYKNEMLKGGILFSGLLVFSFLFVILLEYFGQFNTLIRTILFYSFIGLNLFLSYKYLFVPVAKLFSFGKRINRFQAATIIGKFFPSISDRLLNTLQLNENLNYNNSSSYELISASILQKSKALSVIPFSKGIDLRNNLKYVKYVVPIFVVFIGIAVFFPKIVKQGTTRVVNYNKEYLPEAPFSFIIKNKDFTVLENEDYAVELVLKGNSIPENVYLVSSQGKFLMNKASKLASFYVLKRLKENTYFYFEANGFKSTTYSIEVNPKTTIGKFDAYLDYPSYIGKKDEWIKNVNDITIPEGTKVSYDLATKNVENTKFLWSDNTSNSFTGDGFKFSKTFTNSLDLLITLRNRSTKQLDSTKQKVSVIPDMFPTIEVTEAKDSISDALRFFEGSISDDYGVNSLFFVYTVIHKSGEKENFKISLNHSGTTTKQFSHAIDFRRNNLQLEDKIEYYFVVYDNDGVNGSKATKSNLFSYKLPNLEELNDKRDEVNEDTKNKLNEILKKTQDFQKDIKAIKKDVLNSKTTDFSHSKQLEQIKEQHQALQKDLEQLQMQMAESIDEKEQLSEMDKEMLEKQEMLQDLLDKLMDDEMKDLLKKLEELLEKQDKNNVEQKLDNLEMKSEDMNKQLDRSLEMLKRLQVNEKTEDIIKELKELSKKQEDLKDDKGLTKEEELRKQEDINKKFEDLKKELEELKKLNEELKSPLNLGDQDELKEDISKELNDAKDNLEKNKEKQASENQSKSSKKMDQMASDLETMQQQANKKQEEEDINLLRNILESLMTLSFTQEEIMNKFSKVKDKDPYYSKLAKNQRKVVDDTKIVEDSLNAIAMRQPKIASFINKELNDINTNFILGLENIDEHRRKDLGSNLQYVMTSYNNLALMLNESLQQMQSDMNSKPGSGSCDKPGGKGAKPSDSESQDMKEMLKKQLEKMQKGQKPGGEKPGDKPGSKPGSKPGEQGMNMLGLGNKEIAKMAAEQTAIRQKLEQLRNELNKEGKGKGNQLNPLINELEQQEKDLINKQFSKDIIKRQKEILTRLLESEKAMMERGFEEKRQSKSGKNEKYSNQNRLDEYNNQKLKQVELLRSVDPLFKKYYKDKANEYFNTIN